jgi:hypothetical protein
VTTLLWRQAGVRTAVGANSAATRTGLTELSSGRLRTNRRGDVLPPYHLRSRQEAQAACDPGRAGRRGDNRATRRMLGRRVPRLAPRHPHRLGCAICDETGIVMQNSGSRGCRSVSVSPHHVTRHFAAPASSRGFSPNSNINRCCCYGGSDGQSLFPVINWPSLSDGLFMSGIHLSE